MNWRMNTGDWLKTKKANRKKTILVVDDEGFLVDVIFEILNTHGYSVLTATSGEEALQLAKKADHIDLLLTDLIMRPMNGPDLAQELKKQHPDVKVLFMSGYTLDYIRENLGLQNVAFLIKPLSAQDLLEKLPEILGTSNQ
jgi:two-component system cell cycle sensor histidine kinase/response regulator CckA